MLKNYRFHPIVFSTVYSTYLESTTKTYYRLLFGRLKTYIVNEYDGKIKPYNKSNDVWYNLVINQKGMTIDSALKYTAGIVSGCELKNIFPDEDVEYVEKKLRDCKIRNRNLRELNILTVPMVTGIYVSVFGNDLSELIRLRTVYPGSYIIRAYLNDIIQSITSKTATQIANNKYSNNKIIKVIESLDVYLSKVIEKVIQLKKFYDVKKSLGEDFFDNDVLYDFIVFVNTCRHCDGIFEYIKNHDYYSARVYIAKTIRDFKTKGIKGKLLFKYTYDLLINYFIYRFMYDMRYAKYFIEHRFKQEQRIYNIDKLNNGDNDSDEAQFLRYTIDTLIEHI